MSKDVKTYYLLKSISAIIQTVILFGCFLLIDLPLSNKFLILSIGLLVGCLIGKIRWYYSNKVDDGINVSLIMGIGESVIIIPIIAIFLLIIFYGAVSYILGILSIWIGYAYIMFFNIYSFEKQHGVLPVIPIYQRVSNGQESMIDETATVLTQCNPIGTIKYKSVIWNAESIDGTLLEKDDRVLIKDVIGLKTIIEKI